MICLFDKTQFQEIIFFSLITGKLQCDKRILILNLNFIEKKTLIKVIFKRVFTLYIFSSK